MGGRGSFININEDNFNFTEGGQKYFALEYDANNNIKYLVQPKGSVKVPDYSHSGDRIYVILQNNEIKSIGIYENHVKVKSIDLRHTHKNKDGTILYEHFHTDLFHKGDAEQLTAQDWDIVNKAKNGVKKIYEKK